MYMTDFLFNRGKQGLGWVKKHVSSHSDSISRYGSVEEAHIFLSSRHNIIWYGLAIWFSSFTVQCKARLKRKVSTATKIIGRHETFRTLQALNEGANKILNGTHALFQEYELLPSGRCYRASRYRSNRFKMTFIQLLNKHKVVRRPTAVRWQYVALQPKSNFPVVGNKVHLISHLITFIWVVHIQICRSATNISEVAWHHKFPGFLILTYMLIPFISDDIHQYRPAWSVSICMKQPRIK